jgi:hypothetical protein
MPLQNGTLQALKLIKWFTFRYIEMRNGRPFGARIAGIPFRGGLRRAKARPGKTKKPKKAAINLSHSQLRYLYWNLAQVLRLP